MPTTWITKLPFATGNTALPKITALDPLESSGSLLLIDPTHPVSPMASGVPVDGSVIPNVMEKTALGLLGGTDYATVRPIIKVPASFTDSAGKFERTGKGGLHGISPQGGNAVAGSGPVIYLPTQIIAYILAHPTHSYYASVWGQMTRLPTTSYNNSAWLGINGTGQQANSALAYIAPKGTPATEFQACPSTAGSKHLARRSAPVNSQVGGHYQSIAMGGWQTLVAGVQMSDPQSLPGDGTNATITGTYAGGIIPWGSSAQVPGAASTGATTPLVTVDATTTAGNKDKADSHIIYRVYLEDLTVSGRTHTDVDAIDYAYYTRQVLTAGGRYYGDTYTNPTSVP